jgi:hypothetical protein
LLLLDPEFLSHDFATRALETPSTSPASPTTSSTTASSSTTTAASRTTSICSLFACLVLRLWRVVNQECVERQTVGKDKVSDGGPAHVDCVQRDCFSAFDGHLDSSKSGVHLRRNRCDGSMENCAYTKNCSAPVDLFERYGVGREGCDRVLNQADREVLRRVCEGVYIPFFSSMVTLSLMHFIRNLCASVVSLDSCEQAFYGTEELSVDISLEAGELT